MRTVEEILKQYEIAKKEDLLGLASGDFLLALPFVDAANTGMLADDVTVEDWEQPPSTPEAWREYFIQKIKEYMPFAWEKANNKRGLSASRSIMHMKNWCWLLGDLEALKIIQETEYEFYGKSTLEELCRHFGISNQDDGVRENE